VTKTSDGGNGPAAKGIPQKMYIVEHDYQYTLIAPARVHMCVFGQYFMMCKL
jgi:hypothetical protein